MDGGPVPEDERSSPLLQNQRPLHESNSPRALPAQASPVLTPVSGGSFSYRLPTFPRNVSICQLAGGTSEEENHAHKRIQQKLIAALCLAFVFMIVEVVGGFYAHSLAIITDAAHLLSDVSGFAVAVLAAIWAKRRSHEHFSYGYHRVEVLGALASVMTVWLVTGILLFEAVQRIITPEPVNGKLMFIIAVIGVGVNLLMLAIFGHNHGGHDHGSHNHAHGGPACSDHGAGIGGKASSKRQLDPVLEVAAESSRSNSQADSGAGEGRCNHGHGHKHKHKHSSDLEAGHVPHEHTHPEEEGAHPHHHAHGSDKEEGHSWSHAHCHHGRSSDEEDDQLLNSGRMPILVAVSSSHSHCDHDRIHGSGGGSGGAAHAHGGGGSSGSSHNNLNMRGAVIHVIGDFVQSIGVAIAGALIWWHQGNPAWYIADPICTFLFAVLVLWTTRAILRDIGDVLMERVPRGLCIKTINDDLSRLVGVESIGDLHVWSLTPGIPLLCAHVNLSDEADPTDVLHTVTQYCRSLGIEHSTIQLTSCGISCDVC